MSIGRLSLWLARIDLEPTCITAHQTFAAIGIAGANRSGTAFCTAHAPYTPQAVPALTVAAALLAYFTSAGLRIVCPPERSQREGSEADTESLQCRAAWDRSGHGFGQFIEFVVHNFSFVLVLFIGFAVRG